MPNPSVQTPQTTAPLCNQALTSSSITDSAPTAASRGFLGSRAEGSSWVAAGRGDFGDRGCLIATKSPQGVGALFLPNSISHRFQNCQLVSERAYVAHLLFEYLASHAYPPAGHLGGIQYSILHSNNSCQVLRPKLNETLITASLVDRSPQVVHPSPTDTDKDRKALLEKVALVGNRQNCEYCQLLGKSDERTKGSQRKEEGSRVYQGVAIKIGRHCVNLCASSNPNFDFYVRTALKVPEGPETD